MHALRTAAGAFCLVLFAGVGPGRTADRASRILVPRPVAPSVAWQGPQYLQADRHGNVYLLRGEMSALEAYPLEGAAAGEPRRFQVSGLVDEEVTQAALSSDGRRWAVATPQRVLLFEDGKPRATPPVGWFVTSLAMLRDVPVVGVLPATVGVSPTARRPSSPPLLLQLEGDRWRPFVLGNFAKRSSTQDPFDALFTEHTVDLAADPQGRSWVIYPYTGRVSRLSPAGRFERRLVLGSGVARQKEDVARLRRDFDQKLRQKGLKSPNALTGVFTAKLAVRGATASRGDLYLILDGALTGIGPALARYNTTPQLVETIPLRLPEEGEITMAAGRAGIYFGSELSGRRRWLLTWPEIEGAGWVAWKQARFPGVSTAEPLQGH